jgi:hypothetical protein
VRKEQKNEARVVEDTAESDVVLHSVEATGISIGSSFFDGMDEGNRDRARRRWWYKEEASVLPDLV